VELADSHAHLDAEEFNPDRDKVIERAWAAGVRSLLCPADLTSEESLGRVLELRRTYPWIIAAAGVHPHQAKLFQSKHLDRIADLAAAGVIAAVGEIGLDFHYDFSPVSKQKEALRAQIGLAARLGLPVILHSRKSGREMAALVEEEQFGCGGILHCFTEDEETARKMIDLGFLVSFSGILTYAGARALREAARAIPSDRLLIETDSPYLIPEGRRGRVRRNEPAFIVETAACLAELKALKLAEVGSLTRRNFERLFGRRENLSK